MYYVRTQVQYPINYLTKNSKCKIISWQKAITHGGDFKTAAKNIMNRVDLYETFYVGRNYVIYRDFIYNRWFIIQDNPISGTLAFNFNYASDPNTARYTIAKLPRKPKINEFMYKNLELATL